VRKEQRSMQRPLALLIASLLVFGGTTLAVRLDTSGAISNKTVYFDMYSQRLSVPRFGMLVTTRLEIQDALFPERVVPANDETAEEQEELGLTYDESRIFYRGKGCPECFDTGYRGRTAVFEIFPLTIQVRRMVAAGKGRESIEKLLEAPGSDFVSLKQNAMRLLESGETTVDEVLRVVYEDI